MAEPAIEAATFLAAPSKPKLKLPAGACDAHVHVFGPRARYPYVSERAGTHDAPKERLFALHDFLGIQRCCVVQSLVHGYDNSAAADAIAAKGGAYKGVALVPTTIADAELKKLDAQGFCGARFHYMNASMGVRHLGKSEPVEDVLAFAKRLAYLGWHLQVHVASNVIGELSGALKRSPVPVVIDHIGRVDASRGLEQPPFRDLLVLMQDEKMWVKVSGADRITKEGPPYADAVPFAQKLLAEFGERCVWGTDWPHPNHAGPIPDDGALIDLLAAIAPTDKARNALLVENPQKLYRFSA